MNSFKFCFCTGEVLDFKEKQVAEAEPGRDRGSWDGAEERAMGRDAWAPLRSSYKVTGIGVAHL